ncbi:MBOAT family protein, partial [Helicobacter sp. MIT 14-3879]
HFLENIHGRNETIIYLVLAFILCLGFKNSVELMQSTSRKSLYIAGLCFSLCVILMLPDENPPPFLYFNF